MLWIATANPTHKPAGSNGYVVTIKTGLNKIISNKLIIDLSWPFLPLLAGVQSILKKTEFYPEVNKNVYIITTTISFSKILFTHLSEHKDLYQMYPRNIGFIQVQSNFFFLLWEYFPCSLIQLDLCLLESVECTGFVFRCVCAAYLSPKQKVLLLLLCVFLNWWHRCKILNPMRSWPDCWYLVSHWWRRINFSGSSLYCLIDVY